QEILVGQKSDPFCKQLENWHHNRKSIPFSCIGYFKKFNKDNSLWKYKRTAIVIPDPEYQQYFLKKFHDSDEAGHFG
ncbi:hypothetical protein HK096_003996, partial [Nowakowskiella sp. JEL0078]